MVNVSISNVLLDVNLSFCLCTPWKPAKLCKKGGINQHKLNIQKLSSENIAYIKLNREQNNLQTIYFNN